jgi:cobalamin biosynthesis protein CobT
MSNRYIALAQKDLKRYPLSQLQILAKHHNINEPNIDKLTYLLAKKIHDKYKKNIDRRKKSNKKNIANSDASDANSDAGDASDANSDASDANSEAGDASEQSEEKSDANSEAGEETQEASEQSEVSEQIEEKTDKRNANSEAGEESQEASEEKSEIEIKLLKAIEKGNVKKVKKILSSVDEPELLKDALVLAENFDNEEIINLLKEI